MTDAAGAGATTINLMPGTSVTEQATASSSMPTETQSKVTVPTVPAAQTAAQAESGAVAPDTTGAA